MKEGMGIASSDEVDFLVLLDNMAAEQVGWLSSSGSGTVGEPGQGLVGWLLS